MAKSKKEFNKEAMYKKIMPSMYRTNEDTQKQEKEKSIDTKDEIVNSSLSKIFKEVEKISVKDNEDINIENEQKDINEIEDIVDNADTSEELKIEEETHNESQIESSDYYEETVDDNLSIYTENKYTVNFIEVLVKDKLSNVLEKFKCCQCESCLADIVDISLNNLPKYEFTGTKKEIEEAFLEFKHSNNVDVVSAIIKAIVLIRKKENHKKMSI